MSVAEAAVARGFSPMPLCQACVRIVITPDLDKRAEEQVQQDFALEVSLAMLLQKVKAAERLQPTISAICLTFV